MNARKRKNLHQRFMTAVAWGSSRQVATLLRAGTDPNPPDRSGGSPPYQGSVHGRAGIVRLLLAAGADPRLREDHGRGHTATELAERVSHHGD